MMDFQHKLSRLIELDNSLNESIDSGRFIYDEGRRKSFFDQLSEFDEIKKSIKTEFAKLATVEIENSEERELLRKINSGDPFVADRVIKILAEQTNEEPDSEEFDREEIEKLSWEELFNWFGPYEYIESLIEIGVLITSVSIPNNLSIFVEEARRCYAFQQLNAVNALCRTILETAIRDICLRTGKVQKYEDEKEFYDKYPMSQLIKIVSKGSQRKKIKNLYYGQLSSLIHGFKTIRSANIKIALKETLEIVQELYDQII